MKMKLHLIYVILIFSFLNPGCKKEGRSNYIKANINGSSWRSNSISVETINTGTGVAPFKITGYFNTELISIRMANPNPGNYPFRVDNINPATLISFTVENFESSHRLKWATGNEVNVSSFSLEASTDGLNWTTLGSKPAAGSNSNYEFVRIDITVGINVYYRLKATDMDGTIRYSNILLVAGSYTCSYKPATDIERMGYGGNLEILSFDQGKKIITGRFNFKIKTPAGQVYTVTNGEFRTNY